MAATNIETWQTASVQAVEEVAEGIQRIELRPNLPVVAAPGSHLDVMVTIGTERHRRSYSIVDSSASGDLLAISVMRAPQSRGGSLFMHALRAGEVLEVTQPLQNFPLRVGAKKYVVLAGGVGITALVGMGSVLARLGADYRFVYVARSRRAMAYLDRLRGIHGDRLDVHIDDEGTSLDVAALIDGLDESTELYMCGPIRLMDAVRRRWQGRGLDATRLRYETFGNSGWFTPENFTVRIPRLGVEALVPSGRSMLEVLEDEGVDMMFDCRKGECGLCEVRVLELEGSIDHRDVFYSDRQKEARAKMSCCVSRVVGGEGGTATVTIDV
ncbi:PDR/VanB family oxidoreductase [Salinibacterium hongtaonis]|uniref:Oxidoreductase n=1 Tax=Homoserinimonas hongtaonis TaxID=2079791 RepID=A0A2U1T185_9MICO|nr:PDR/VanB family oxidoreductase [Salinibacterium hongtaonis]PWB97627.1 oxidoreductase [Salinibacterium hongtaonis]